MKFPIDSTVQVIYDRCLYYYGRRGRVVGYNDSFNEYVVFFITTNDKGEESVYGTGIYREDEIFLVDGGVRCE